MTFLSVSFRQIKQPVEITRMYYKDIPLINLVKPRLHFIKDSGMWLGFSLFKHAREQIELHQTRGFLLAHLSQIFAPGYLEDFFCKDFSSSSNIPNLLHRVLRWTSQR
jgi:hypothetical protein